MYLLVKQDAKFIRRTFTYSFPSDPRIGWLVSNEKIICRNCEVVQENTFDVATMKINIEAHLFFIMIKLLIKDTSQKGIEKFD